MDHGAWSEKSGVREQMTDDRRQHVDNFEFQFFLQSEIRNTLAPGS
jgi:hypothetical protein